MKMAPSERLPRGGFSLSQLIGALSVLAILASVVAPVAIRRLDQAARDAEAISLAGLSEAYVQASVKSKQFVVATNFTPVMAAYLNAHTNVVRLNKRGFTRTFLADPNVSIAGAGLPYTQTSSGAADSPSGTRALLISTVAKALPSINATNFDNIWNAAKNTIPSSLSTWGGRGDDLIIERIDFGSKFHKVVLMNVERAPTTGIYSIDTFTTNSVAGLTRVSGYFIDGTALNLYRPDGTKDFTETITEDISFVFQNSRWSRKLSATDDTRGDFGQLVDRFLQQPVPCDPGTGATQRSVINAFYDYLWGYADWAFGDPKASPPVPPFAGSGVAQTPQFPSYSVIVNAQNHLSGNTASFAKNLIE